MGSAEECRSPSSKVSPATLHHYAATHVFGSASVLLPKRLSYALGISLQRAAQQEARRAKRHRLELEDEEGLPSPAGSPHKRSHRSSPGPAVAVAAEAVAGAAAAAAVAAAAGAAEQEVSGEAVLRLARGGNRRGLASLLDRAGKEEASSFVNYQEPVSGETPLAAASAAGHAQVVKLLLERGADVYLYDEQTVSPLMKAAAGGHAVVVKLLLLEGEADAFHMAHGSGGRTALIEAAASGSAACVKLLLKHGGGLDVRQADEKTGTYPLLEAVAFGQLDAARVLLGVQGVKVNQTDKEGRTPLLLAARSGDARLVSLLLAMPGIKPDIAEFTERRTPLMEAACNGHAQVVKSLLEAGADAQARDTHGKTALELAGLPRIRALLQHASSMQKPGRS